MKNFIVVSTAVLTCCFTSCSSSPLERIEANRPAFQQLPSSQQTLVLQGQITTGMSPEAVRLAWGDPDHITTGVVNHLSVERWIYRKNGGWSFGVGAGVSHFHDSSRWLNGSGLGIGVPLGSIPPNTSWVLFTNDKVTSWEQSPE